MCFSDYDDIRRAIYEVRGKWGECGAYRTPDGTIFIYRGKHLENKYDSHGEQDRDMEHWTPKERESAVRISCLDCPDFYECSDIDSLVDEFEEEYGEPFTVEDVLKTRGKRRKKKKKKEQEEQIIGTIIQQSRVLNGTGLSLRSDLCEINSPFWQTSIQVSGTLSSKTENRQEPDKDTPQRDDESYIIGCPFCGQHLEVPIELDNTTINCPSCNKEIHLTKEDAIEERCSEKNGCFRFECPFCQVNLEVPDELDNTTANCPACNKEIHLKKKDATS